MCGLRLAVGRGVDWAGGIADGDPGGADERRSRAHSGEIARGERRADVGRRRLGVPHRRIEDPQRWPRPGLSHRPAHHASQRAAERHEVEGTGDGRQCVVLSALYLVRFRDLVARKPQPVQTR